MNKDLHKVIVYSRTKYPDLILPKHAADNSKYIVGVKTANKTFIFTLNDLKHLDGAIKRRMGKEIHTI